MVVTRGGLLTDTEETQQSTDNQQPADNQQPTSSTARPDGALCAVLERLLCKDTTPVPKNYYKGHNITFHLRAVEKYVQALGLDKNESRAMALVNSLEEEVQTELFAQPEYEQHDGDYEWLKTTLTKMYQRSASTSPRVQLLGIKQKQSQSLADFSTELRVEAYKHWPESASPQAKETFLLAAFLNGVLDRDVALAVQVQQPASLEQALALAMNESKHSVEQGNHVRAMAAMKTQENVSGLTLTSLQQQITVLRQQVQHLESLLNSRSGGPTYAGAVTMNSPPRQFVPRYQNPTRVAPHSPKYGNSATRPSYQPGQPRQPAYGVDRPITCYNCNQPGHISRECPLGIRCFQCGGLNHISRMCPNNANKVPGPSFRPNTMNRTPGPPFLRQLNGVDSSSQTPAGQDESDPTEETEEPEESASLMAISRPIANVKRRAVLYSPSQQQQRDVEQWDAYIHGKGRRPKQTGAKTLISEHHAELARNKPLVEGRCAGVKTKLFLDSGAELNVVDYNFVLRLLEQDLKVPFKAGTSQLQCANGSRMVVMGYASLPVQVGCATVTQKFSVVKDLFPKVIIGIRTMKTMGLVIDPANDSVVVNGAVRIPFVSKIHPETIIPDRSVKGNGPFPGAGKSPRF